MTRKLKTLGVALVAVFALTAVAASTASAYQYTASTYPTTGTGESAIGNDTFTTEGGTVECKSHFEGTLSEASTDLTVTAKYTNCRAFGFLEAEVSHCKYTFTEPTTDGKGGWHAQVHVVGAPCTIKASTCHVTVPLQNSLGNVTINNLATGDVSVQANVTAIEYNVITDGFLCPFNGTGKKFGATYKQHNPITFDAVNPASASIGVS
jgi:hypothetical protein